MTEKISGLNVRDLLKRTCAILSERHSPREVEFDERVLVKTADDSGWHRFRAGYMSYEGAGIFQLDNKNWAIARGEACGHYPADSYDTDIIAIEFDTYGKSNYRTRDELSTEIREGSYFANSLVFGFSDGELAVNIKRRSRFGEAMKDRLVPRVGEFIAQAREYDESILLLSTLQPLITRPMLYKLEFADFLADTIEEVLRNDRE